MVAYIAMAAAVAAIVAVRVWQLGSDPYPRLDWSAGLLTDEGFYIHNARNVALFGAARTDAFNNMLLSPILHAVQVAWFRLVGVGAIQARLVSVVAALAAIALMHTVMFQWFGKVAAWATSLVLGLDHSVFLFNRMALMDTPAMLGGILALWCFSKALRASSARRSTPWFVLCGIALGITLANRSLCLFMLPAPALALMVDHDQEIRARWRRLGVIMGAGVAVLGVVGIAWTLPNRAEIGTMTRYYRVHQLQPKSVQSVARNLTEGLFGDHRGAAPYWFRHMPVVFLLALGCCLATFLGVRAPGAARGVEVYLLAWFVAGWVMLSFVSYSPSRYYVSLYPAMVGLASIALSRLGIMANALAGPGRAAAAVRAALCWIAGYHVALSFVHHGGVVDASLTALCLYAIPTAIALAGAARPAGWMSAEVGRPLFASVALLWVSTNGYWVADWARSMAYTQRDACRAIARLMPDGGVLIGDVAPGVTLDNRLAAVNVIPELCNDGAVVERFSGRPRAIAILDGRWKERWWTDHYPGLVSAPRAALRMRVLRWDVGVYLVDAGPDLSQDAVRPAADRS